jgi:1-deoxy-D-xylulose-5-phosphate reductoisomerase
MKRLGILGATGSIGTQALDIIRQHPKDFDLILVSGHRNLKRLLQIDEAFRPRYIWITDPEAYALGKTMNFSARLVQEGTDLLDAGELDLVLNAMVGSAGLHPTLKAIEGQVDVALANKESLVTGGAVIQKALEKSTARLIPVDSEHSAIFQCLQGLEEGRALTGVILTASGGPFRGMKSAEVRGKKAKEALKHPNWAMGRKISIDSATLVNKGLEVIEAKWLFDLSPEAIEVVVHPQSIIHSLVRLKDTAVLAQLGYPDMHLPLHYALHYPERRESRLENFSFEKIASLTFERVDDEVFPGLMLGYQAISAGGSMPVVYNMVNEIMVAKYLRDEISFYDITDTIAREMARHTPETPMDYFSIRELEAQLKNRLE